MARKTGGGAGLCVSRRVSLGAPSLSSTMPMRPGVCLEAAAYSQRARARAKNCGKALLRPAHNAPAMLAIAPWQPSKHAMCIRCIAIWKRKSACVRGREHRDRADQIGCRLLESSTDIPQDLYRRRRVFGRIGHRPITGRGMRNKGCRGTPIPSRGLPTTARRRHEPTYGKASCDKQISRTVEAIGA